MISLTLHLPHKCRLSEIFHIWYYKKGSLLFACMQSICCTCYWYVQDNLRRVVFENISAKSKVQVGSYNSNDSAGIFCSKQNIWTKKRIKFKYFQGLFWHKRFYVNFLVLSTSDFELIASLKCAKRVLSSRLKKDIKGIIKQKPRKGNNVDWYQPSCITLKKHSLWLAILHRHLKICIVEWIVIFSFWTMWRRQGVDQL